MKRWPLEALFAGSGGVAFPRMTALVGAGGKTTLMYALARRMADAGRRVVCTTTTKIFPPEDGLPVVLLEGAADPVAAVHDALSAVPCVVAAVVILYVCAVSAVTIVAVWFDLFSVSVRLL